MSTYEIAQDGASIKCLRCGRTSYSLGDVENLYCGACGYHAQFAFDTDPVRYYRCLGCGSMDEEMAGPCVLEGVSHHEIEVDEQGDLLPPKGA